MQPCLPDHFISPSQSFFSQTVLGSESSSSFILANWGIWVNAPKYFQGFSQRKFRMIGHFDHLLEIGTTNKDV